MSAGISFNELGSIAHLPSPSGTALAIIKLVQKEHATVNQLAQLVKTDPALSGRILSFANSPAFGAGRTIACIEDAAVMMGMQTVRNFALSLSLLDTHRHGNCGEFDYAIFWSQSLATAIALAALTTLERTVAPEEAFTLGLLANIGYLALASAWPEAYGECLKQGKGDQLLKLEYARFAIDHRTMSQLLLADWGLPELFLESLKMSFASEITGSSRSGRLSRQLMFARQLARYCLADPANQPALLIGLEKETCHHAMEKTQLSKLVEQVIEQWHAWGKQINIKTDVRYPLKKNTDASTDDTAGLDLLLADDDPLVLAQLSKKLTEAGYKVATCRDGESALQYLVEHRPPLLITDWRMQPMDGLALCKALRNTAFGKDIYIVMLTSADTEDELVNAFDAGIDDYVNKPVNTKILLSRLHAGQRIVRLQREVEKERRDVQRYTAELLAANRRLELMANTDMLTDLPNRRYGLNRLAQEFEAGLRYKRPMSVLMLDLDHFKSINDSLGHDAGDQVLQHIAYLIRQTVRANDIACRLGGEEFMVIAANTDGATALQLAERLRAIVEKNQPNELPLRQPLTVSIGVAGYDGGQSGWKDLMVQADKALYFVKQTTRNGIHLA